MVKLGSEMIQFSLFSSLSSPHRRSLLFSLHVEPGRDPSGGRVELFRLGNRVSSHGSPQRQLDDDQPQQGLPGSLLIYLFDFFIFFISLKKDNIDSLLFIYSFVLSLYYSYVALRHLPSMPVRSYVSIHHRPSGKRQFSV